MTISVKINPAPITRWDRWIAVSSENDREMAIGHTQAQAFGGARLYATRLGGGAVVAIFSRDGRLRRTHTYRGPTAVQNENGRTSDTPGDC